MKAGQQRSGVTQAVSRNRMGGLSDTAVVGLALVASAALVWLVSGDGLLVAVLTGTLLVFAGLAWMIANRRPEASDIEFAQPDWSVTVAAIDRTDTAIAVTDRAGRLACANGSFELWFGTANPPPRLPVDDAAMERLTDAVRAAWRDGHARAEVRTEGDTAADWRVEIQRSGRGTTSWSGASSPSARSISWGTGAAGRRPARQGPGAGRHFRGRGRSRRHDPGRQRRLSQRATGDALSDMTGLDFVSLISQEEGERIGWARDAGAAVRWCFITFPLPTPNRRSSPIPTSRRR